jgi:hypothetical protein
MIKHVINKVRRDVKTTPTSNLKLANRFNIANLKL